MIEWQVYHLVSLSVVALCLHLSPSEEVIPAHDQSRVVDFDVVWVTPSDFPVVVAPSDFPVVVASSDLVAPSDFQYMVAPSEV